MATEDISDIAQNPYEDGPLTKEHKYLLRELRIPIVNDLHAKDVVDNLIQNFVLTSEDVEAINNEATRRRRAEALLEKLEDRGEKGFYTFLDSLKTTYKHIWLLITNQLPEYKARVVQPGGPLFSAHKKSQQKQHVSDREMRNLYGRGTWGSFVLDLKDAHSRLIADSIQEDEIHQGALDLDDFFVELVIELGILNRAEQRRGYNILTLENQKDVNPTIMPEELFDNKPEWTDHKQPVRVLMRGRAGIGKTTLMKKIISDWVKGDIWLDKFHAIFYFEFRQLNGIRTELSLLDLLLIHHSPNVTEEDMREIGKHIEENPSRVLLIFDGFDEFHRFENVDTNEIPNIHNCSHKTDLHVLIWNIMRGNLLEHSHLIITSRPRAAIKCRRMHRTVEIYGLTSDKVMDFVDKYCKSNKEMAQQIKGFLKNNSSVCSFCYIPVNCWFICECLQQLTRTPDGKSDPCDDYGDVEQSNFPETSTQLYKLALSYFVMKRHPAFKNKNVCDDPFEIFPKVSQNFRNLAGLASWCMKGKSVRIVMYAKDLKKYRLMPSEEDFMLGFLSSAKMQKQFRIEVEYFSFIHLTLQESLSACDMVQCSKEQINDFVLASGHSQYDMVFIFLSGFLGDPQNLEFLTLVYEGTQQELDAGELQGKARFLLRTVADFNQTKSKLQKILLMMMLFESQLPDMADFVADYVMDEAGNIELDKSQVAPSECKALAYMMCHMDRTTNILSLTNNRIGDGGLKYLCESLDGRKGCRELHLRNNNLSDVSCQGLKMAMMKSSVLTTLDLVDNEITENGAYDLAHGLRNSPSMKELTLDRNNIGDSGVCHIAESIPLCSTFQKLALRGNGITDAGAISIGRAMQQSQSLRIILLHGNFIGADGVKCLAQGLAASKTMYEFGLGQNRLDHKAACYLSVALRVNSSLEVFGLGGNPLGDQGVITIINSLTQNETLRELSLRGNNITEEGFRCVLDVIPNMKRLEYLTMAGNDVTPEVRRLFDEAVCKRRQESDAKFDIRF